MLHKLQIFFFHHNCVRVHQGWLIGLLYDSFLGEGAQCTQHSGGFPLGEPKWGHHPS